MSGQVGQFLILVATAAAAFSFVVGMAAGARRSLAGIRYAQQGIYIFGLSMVLANLWMIRALLTHDFSISYVAQVGSRTAPTWISIVSLWSSLEGSILFWGAILGIYLSAFAWTYRDRYREYMGFALGTMAFVACFFSILLAGPAHPFSLMNPIPDDGPGPNPLLQNHILMVAHPPMLYLGYVGMTVPFGIAVAALLRGRLTEGWLKPLRRWTMVPWAFLSVGIVMGGWWAYEVLGWGGYWAWDPVENASFLPWLAATAYLHSTLVQERRRMLKAWTLSLVLAAFSLTILGTFMTRSGVFNSVHSFTQSAIGPLFLVFLGIILCVSIGLLAGRSHLFAAENQILGVASRETAFLFNNLIFSILTFTVLLGTVFPLLTEALRDVKISVGEPYFNKMAVPLGMALVFLMGVGPALPWGKANTQTLIRTFVVPFAVGLLIAIVALLLGLREPLAIGTFALCGFAATTTLREMFYPVIQRITGKKESFSEAFMHSLAASRRRFGGYVVHLGILVIAASIAASQTYRIATEASMTPGESFEIRGYKLTYEETVAVEEAHRFSIQARVHVEKNGQPLGELRPRLNFYPTQREPVGTPIVRSAVFEDLYLSLLSFEKDGSRVAIKAFVIPMVPWIWWSLPLIALGSLIALWPRRRSAVFAPAHASGAHVS